MNLPAIAADGFLQYRVPHNGRRARRRGGMRAAARFSATRAASLRLLSATAGIGGRVMDGKFVLAEERTSFSREHDKELFVSFMWAGTPGTHRLVATWRGPDGTISSAAPIEYQAKEPRFGAFWQLPLSPTMAMGPWSVDITVNGQPGGRLTFDIKAEAVPVVATKRLPTQAQLFEALNTIHVIVQRTTSAGRALEPAAAMVASDGRLYTAVSVLDEADRLQAHSSSGNNRAVDALVAEPSRTVGGRVRPARVVPRRRSRSSRTRTTSTSATDASRWTARRLVPECCSTEWSPGALADHALRGS